MRLTLPLVFSASKFGHSMYFSTEIDMCRRIHLDPIPIVCQPNPKSISHLKHSTRTTMCDLHVLFDVEGGTMKRLL